MRLNIRLLLHPLHIILKKEGTGILEVQDEGWEYPKKNINGFFKNFTGWGMKTPGLAQGTGLGLYLCRKIAQDHKMQSSGFR